MKSKLIKCANCQQDFVFNSGEQEFYAKKGLKDPVFCPICRGTHQAAKKDKFRGHFS